MNITKAGLMVELDPSKKYLVLLDKQDITPAQAQGILKTVSMAKAGDVVLCLVGNTDESIKFVEVDSKTIMIEKEDGKICAEGQDEAGAMEDAGGAPDANQESTDQG